MKKVYMMFFVAPVMVLLPACSPQVALTALLSKVKEKMDTQTAPTITASGAKSWAYQPRALDKSIGLGDQHTCVKWNEKVYCSGSSSNYRLDSPYSASQSLQSEFGTNPISIINASVFPQVSKDVVSLVGGAGFSLLLKSDGSIVHVGENRTILANQVSSAIAVGPMGFITFSNGLIPGYPGGTPTYSSRNNFSQLGYSTIFSSVGDVALSFSMSTNTNSVLCAIGRDRLAYCLGDNTLGQLGSGDIKIYGGWASVLGVDNVDRIVVGTSHACALSEGSVFCWGANSKGQLGQGYLNGYSPVAMSVPALNRAVAIAAGDDHTCAVKEGDQGDEIWCWGKNSEGQLGYGNNSSQAPAPVQVRPWSWNQDFGSAVKVSKLVAGGNSTCAVINDDLYCWGANTYQRLFPTQAITFTQNSPQIVLTSASSTSKVRSPISVALSSDRLCYISSGRSFVCAGNNYGSMLGVESTDIVGFTTWTLPSWETSTAQSPNQQGVFSREGRSITIGNGNGQGGGI